MKTEIKIKKFRNESEATSFLNDTESTKDRDIIKKYIDIKIYEGWFFLVYEETQNNKYNFKTD